MVIKLKIIRKNGEEYPIDGTIGIVCTSFTINSPSPIHQRGEFDGIDGFRDLGTTYEGRTIEAGFKLLAYDWAEYALLRNLVFHIFDSKEEFYLISMDEPNKRWRVKCDSSYGIKRLATVGSADISFISPSAYAESIGSPLDPYTFESELWQFGMNIPMVDFAYKHNTRTFSIWNLGDKHINPRHDMLQIFYKGASNNLKITNTTTNEVWQYNGSSQSNDTIELDGVFSRKNGTSIFSDTNRKLISLAPGENIFTLTGTSGAFEIAFDFRFMYL